MQVAVGVRHGDLAQVLLSFSRRQSEQNEQRNPSANASSARVACKNTVVTLTVKGLISLAEIPRDTNKLPI